MNPPEIFTKIQLILAEVTGNEPADVFADSSFHEYFVMSPFELAQFLASIETNFGIKISKADFTSIDTVQDLVTYLDEAIN